MIAIQPQSRQILGVNQQAYQSLKAAMSLNLRRQLLIAVCDSATLQEQLATQLENDLQQEGLPAERFDLSTNQPPPIALDRLIFDPEDAHLPRQIAQWVRQTMLSTDQLPQLQMLGIEQMTRQSAPVQNHFLRSLEKVEVLLPRLNTSLLIWVPWPWLRTIQSSAPTFWKWRSGVFEFVSDPTPTASAWDDSFDPDMFDDDLDASADSLTALPFSQATQQSPDQAPLVQNLHAQNALTQDDLLSDYAEPEPSPIGLYGESGEGDSPMLMQSVTAEQLEVESQIAEPAAEAEPTVEAASDSAKEITHEPTADQTEPKNGSTAVSDQDFAQGLIESFVQNSSELPVVDSVNDSTADPILNLVIDPLFEPSKTPNLASQPEAERTKQPKDTDEIGTDRAKAEQGIIAESETASALQMELEPSAETILLVDEAAEEESGATNLEPVTLDNLEEGLGPDLEDVTAEVSLENTELETDEWNLLAAVTLAFQANVAEAQRLKAAATKWISKSPDKSKELTAQASEDVTQESENPVPLADPTEILSLPAPEILEIEPSETESSETEVLEAEAKSADQLEPTPAKAEFSSPAETPSEPAILVETVILETEEARLQPLDTDNGTLSGQATTSINSDQVACKTRPSAHPTNKQSPTAAEQASHTSTRLQIASPQEIAAHSVEPERVDDTEISNDLDFTHDLEKDLIISESEIIDLETSAEAATADQNLLIDSRDEAALRQLESTDSSAVAPVVPEEIAEVASMGSQHAVDRSEAAADYFAVGYRYRTRIEAGERDLPLIESAIAAYEGGLQCLKNPHPDWASGLNDLGTLYWLKAQQINDAQQEWDCMNHSISLYQQALTKIEAQELPEMVCQLYSNMGAVYSILATYQAPIKHLQRAINVYCQAIRKCPISADPIEYATLNNSLGSVYWKLSHYEDVPQNLRHAIAAYTQALRGYNPENLPLDYASVQNNIGITYWSLAKHEAAVPSLKNAVEAYYEALKHRTAKVDPAACAVTYNNLALAYWDLSKNEEAAADIRLRYRRNAITAFEAALNTAEISHSLSDVDSAAIYHCLGDVHAQTAESMNGQKDIAQSLRKSLHSYVRAIKGLSEDSPIFQARLSAIAANIRSHYEYLGLASQQTALNSLPAELLPIAMKAL